MHRSSSNHHKYNQGIFLIYSIIEFSKIKNNLQSIDKKGNKIIQNCIICELDIKKANQNIRMINSYEQAKREYIFDDYKKEKKMKKK